ncbi:MAG: hydroxyacylglutathione hydrolase [Candidatus Endobugula sp.]|jgi:hydroxyacylglutathione hydrolase
MLHISPIPALSDNYFWLLTEHPLLSPTSLQPVPAPQTAYIIDPGDGEAVLQVLQRYNLTLVGIFITHRHYDHVDGIRFLVEEYSTAHAPIPVYGPTTEAIPQITHPVFEGDTITLFEKHALTVMETPGHTEEHLVYYSETANNTPILFCGDTLFAAGCGRLMGGNAEQLHQSLQRLAALPDNTQVHCAHEYTLANLHFAQAVEPNNSILDQRIADTIKDRENDKPTVPFELLQEKQSNPFLRVSESTVQAAVKQHWDKNHVLSEVDTFTLLRRWKDNF